MSSDTRKSYTLYIGSIDGVIRTWPDLYLEVKVDKLAVQRTPVIKQYNGSTSTEKFILTGNTASVVSVSFKQNDRWLRWFHPCKGRVDITIGTLLAQCADNQFATLQVNTARSLKRYRDRSVGEIMIKLSLSTPIDEEVIVAEGLAKELSELGMSQLGRFFRLGNLSDIEDSISNLHKATQLIDDEHANKAAYLDGLGTSQRARFDRLGDLNNIEDSISNSHKAVYLTDDSHPNKGIYLNTLGLSQRGRFDRLGDLADIEDSISNLHKAVQLTDEGHLNKASSLSNLGLSQRARF